MTSGHPIRVRPPGFLLGSDFVRVAIGGTAGATVRWAVAHVAASTSAFPWPTLVVNLVGCLVLGLLLHASRSTTVLVGIGFAGGLTTFSTFAVEIASLLRDSDAPTAAGYLAVSLVGGVLAVLAGQRVARP